jgi:RNA polymerase sigma-70 factor, ECF subfamily
VTRAIAGDYDAFSALVRASASRQYAVATLILHDRDIAQDAVQDALIRAWRGLSALRDPSAWDAWLHRLTVRACYAAAHREKRRIQVEVTELRERREEGVADEQVSLGERDRMERQLGRLPLDQRAVLVLHFYVGLPLTEAAAILDIPPGTAKSRLHRGLEALRSSLGREGGIQEPQSKERLA